MKSRTLFFGILSFVFVSCASHQVEKQPVDPIKSTAEPSDVLPRNFKFSFFISASEWNAKFSDSWTMDTTGMITIITSEQTSPGKFRTLNALATLDPQDMDSIRMLIRNGKLYEIDSTNLNQQCGGKETYIVRIIPLAQVPHFGATFDACAADYNLLLEPQRQYLRRFLDWWERMRVKYRPNAAE